jgi:hypothetical protein
VDGGPASASSTNLTVTATLGSFSPAGGRIGTTVDITGSGFTSVTDIRFANTSVGGAGHFTVNSATEIHAAVPAGATDGMVTVVRSVGGNLISAGTFKILSVTSVSPSNAHPGDTLTINGTNLGSATGVNFPGVTEAATPNTVTSSSLDVVVPADGGDGALTVRTSDFGNVDTPIVSIVPLPVIDSISVMNTASGSTLHISGSHFVDVTAVRIGTDDVTSGSTVDSPASITVAIPGGETTGRRSFAAGGSAFTPPSPYAPPIGIGQTYYNADAPNTYDLANAMDAAAVYAAGTISQVTCGTDAAVQLVTATEAAIWVYDGGAQGHVYLDTLDTTPICPVATDPTWG